MLDVCVIGHVTKDFIKINDRVKELSGGTAYYTSIALKCLGLNVAVVTRVGYGDEYLLNDLNKNNISVFLRMSSATTVFENIYGKHFNYTDYRTQMVHSVASSFVKEDIPDISPTIFHVGCLTREDIPLEILRFLAKKSIVSLDVQGFLRKIKHGSVKMEDWDEKKEALANVDIIKTNRIEAKILTGKEDIKQAAKILSSFGPKEVIITLGSKGSLIYSQGKFYRIAPYHPRRFMDPTGCGDTYMAGYLYRRLRSAGFTLDFNKIGKFASAIASLKLENYGPFKGTRDEVEHFLKRMMD